MQEMIGAVVEQTTHATEDVSCKWLLVSLGSFIMAMGAGGIAWIKAILKQLDDEKTGRLNDLKERLAEMRRHRKGKEESDVA